MFVCVCGRSRFHTSLGIESLIRYDAVRRYYYYYHYYYYYYYHYYHHYYDVAVTC